MLTAKQLQPGDVLAGSGAVIHAIWRDGLFAHDRFGRVLEPRRPFPKGQVEVFVSYPGKPGVVRREWNARTTVSVLPERLTPIDLAATEVGCDGVEMYPAEIDGEFLGHVAELSRDGEVLYVANVLRDGTVDDLQEAAPR